MKEVEILLFKKENQDLGIGADDEYATLYFREESLAGFWIDPDVDSEANLKEIVFYVASGSFRTPYKKKLAEEFYEILKLK